MALRSVLRKMPALGLTLRSPPMGPLMGPLRALSPATGSRLLSSHGSPEGEIITQEELAGRNARIDRMNAAFSRNYEEFDEIRRQNSLLFSAAMEKEKSIRNTLKMIMFASNTVILLGVPATLYMLNNFLLG